MDIARSARMFTILGATLTALTLSQMAAAETINDASTSGVTQTGVEGVTQTGVLGVTQTGVLGITQTGAQGVTQTGVEGVTQTGLLRGPVTSIDRINSVFESMGQIILASQSMLGSMRIGDYVSVNGTVISSGWLYADDVSVLGESYVPGASAVCVTGIPSAIDLSTGRVQIGGQTIDYTPVLSSGDLVVGFEMSFCGIQPVTRGLLISDAVSVR